MSDFAIICAYILPPIIGLALFWIAFIYFHPNDDKQEWQSGDPGPHYGRDPKGRF